MMTTLPVIVRIVDRDVFEDGKGMKNMIQRAA
jgi:hypothetical protein